MSEDKKRDMEIENLEEELDEVFSDSSVLFAYVHGSRATGRAYRGSDLDIAVFAEEEIGLSDQAGLMRELTKKTGIETDISVLNGSSLSFQHQVVKYGEVVYSVDEEKRKKFEEELYRRYLDIKPLMKKFNEARRKA